MEDVLKVKEKNIIDVNAYIGNWPFRRLRYNTAEGIRELMKRYKIKKCVVSSLNGVLYKNTQNANEDLYQEIKKYPRSFIPLACINPYYPGWEEDLRICINKMKMKGIRLYPNYHNYKLTDECCKKLVNVAIENSLPVFISIRVEDKRGAHWLMVVDEVDIEDVGKLINEYPECVFVLTNISASQIIKLKNMTENKNFYVEISRLEAFGHYDNPRLIDIIKMVGIERVLFGTSMCMEYPLSSFFKVESLNISEEDKKLIYYKNAERLFKL